MRMSPAEREPALAAPALLRGRIPDFFIVGQPKSGTTALYRMLGRHPQIFMSKVKEPYYFACDNPIPERSGGHRWTSLDQTGTHGKTLEEYMALFAEARPDQLAGEASTHYLWWPSAPARIAKAQPAARIIAILREPASFLHSLHLQFIQNRHEDETDLRRALALEDDRRQGRNVPPRSVWPRCLLYSDRVRYVDQLRRYEAVLPREQMLVLIYDDFRSDNQRELRRVLRFLEVDETIPVEPMDANPSVSVRSTRLDDLSRAAVGGRGPVWGTVKSGLKAITPRRLRPRVRRKAQMTRRRIAYGKAPAPDEQLMLELRRRYRGEVLALSEYLDRDLITLWGYDDLA
ncbi:MAG: sulfotransferase [Actinobacteria bacterium]|nr:MAG: sulfotransferase [Actinomycetota bacterium]